MATELHPVLVCEGCGRQVERALAATRVFNTGACGDCGGRLVVGEIERELAARERRDARAAAQ